jgi:DNA-binding XRE family transcriptional regulator
MSSRLEMKVKLDIEPYWPKGLSLEQAERELKEMGLSLNRRSISAIRKGTEKGDWATPFKLARYLSTKVGREIQPQDLFKVEE